VAVEVPHELVDRMSAGQSQWAAKSRAIQKMHREPTIARSCTQSSGMNTVIAREYSMGNIGLHRRTAQRERQIVVEMKFVKSPHT
jgi:hypothetical protein